jgi:Helitron helicase-like domain at N-terminus
MEQEYQNAMTLVGKFSKPDLFITFTANPKWPEIQNHLFKNKGQSAVD